MKITIDFYEYQYYLCYHYLYTYSTFLKSCSCVLKCKRHERTRNKILNLLSLRSVLDKDTKMAIQCATC